MRTNTTHFAPLVAESGKLDTWENAFSGRPDCQLLGVYAEGQTPPDQNSQAFKDAVKAIRARMGLPPEQERKAA